MKKLRVYYKSSILSCHNIFEVASPAEGKVLIDALELTVGEIISENNIQATGAYAIGLEIEDDTTDEGWVDWSSPDGNFIHDYHVSELRELVCCDY